MADANGPYEGEIGVPVQFDGTGSSDLDGRIVDYTWSFGDGDRSDGETSVHVYTRPGHYNVTLEVVDVNGARDSDSTNVFIHGDPDNQLPNCSLAVPSISTIWPPNRRFVPVSIQRVIDPDGDPVNIRIDSIFQDERVDRRLDGRGVGTDTARVRAQRRPAFRGGNGRVYHISYTAEDVRGGICTGEVLVDVPPTRRREAIDDGVNFDSTVPPSQ